MHQYNETYKVEKYCSGLGLGPPGLEKVSQGYTIPAE